MSSFVLSDRKTDFTIELCLNHIKESRNNILYIRFMFDQVDPYVSCTIIYKSYKESITTMSTNMKRPQMSLWTKSKGNGDK